MLSKKRALKQFIDRHIKHGFMHRDDIVQATLVEFRGEFGGSDFCNAVATAVDRSLARYLITESAWVLPTDCDKLEKAFSALENQGILTRQHFTCCNDCGHREIQSEMRRMGRTRSKKMRGFAFFHHQDTDRAVNEGKLYLTFDALGESTVEQALEIGATVISALESVGLKVEWNGSYLQRIGVRLAWRKRRFSADGGGGGGGGANLSFGEAV